MQEQKNKPAIIIAIILFVLILLFCGWYFYLRKTTSPDITFTSQGKTEISAGNITVRVWDDNAEDGDTIQIYFQNALLADTLGILNEPESYPLGKLSPGKYWIGVRALSEGTTAPATSSMLVTNDRDSVTFSMNAWLDSAARWELILK